MIIIASAQSLACVGAVFDARLPPRRRIIVVAARTLASVGRPPRGVVLRAYRFNARVLRGRPRNRLRRNRARGCSRISSGDRAASIGALPAPAPRGPLRRRVSLVLAVLNHLHVQNSYKRYETEIDDDECYRPTWLRRLLLLLLLKSHSTRATSRRAFALREKAETNYLFFIIFYFYILTTFSSSFAISYKSYACFTQKYD